ncbi:polyisoprenoid-binding protein YceI [Actinocorallia herbida]|uniref:Polyisoprenoid-binding protein YceI n=1 Tax=Actinocorallia herbida TaxID=58109 RepID=A0A3N1D2H3_9ACTN|nr:YceI family protein [Actinocorallia herbida]ROO87739.1 polyisoprenoid-binding protein YceI [Actinocorallia herbida]
MSTIPATVAIPDYLVGTWKADPVHSEIAFSVRHLMISKTRGRFTAFDVTIITGEELLDSSATASIDLTSIDTGHAMRDEHLRTADYLEVEKYPTMDYRSTGIRRAGDGWIIDGDLTLHGVTRQLPLAVEVNGFGTDQWNGRRAGFSATAEIDRREATGGPNPRRSPPTARPSPPCTEAGPDPGTPRPRGPSRSPWRAPSRPSPTTPTATGSPSLAATSSPPMAPPPAPPSPASRSPAPEPSPSPPPATPSPWPAPTRSTSRAGPPAPPKADSSPRPPPGSSTSPSTPPPAPSSPESQNPASSSGPRP